MIMLRPANDRGHFNHGWLDTWHTFSFGGYQDPRHMGFRSLRVINEDVIAPGQGFGEHPHRDMEIITYVLDGELEHRDSLGNGAVIRPGVVQYMAAGSGIRHSEFNPSTTSPTHLMQIWIMPDRRAEPAYEERRFPPLSDDGTLALIASPDGRDGSIRINQDASIFAGRLRAGTVSQHELPAGRGSWIQLLRGELMLDGTAIRAGDGAAIEDQRTVRIEATTDAEFLVFDLV